MTRAYVARVLWHPKDRDGNLRLDAYAPRMPAAPGRPPAEESPVESMTRDYRIAGWPEHRARAEAARRQAAFLAARDGPAGRGVSRGA